MDNRRFDQWIRSLRTVGTRRTVSKLLAGGTLGAVLAHREREEAAAACVRLGKQCKSKRGKKKCCGGAKCQGKTCKCPGGRAACGKTCCPKGQICAGRQCVTGQGTCPTGADSCAVGQIFCSPSEFCACFHRLEGGTRCAQITSNSQSDQCGSDADCLALGFPPGSICAQDEGDWCGGPDPARGICFVPCGVVGADEAAAAMNSLLRP